MQDKNLKNNLESILFHIIKCEVRYSKISSPNGFIDSEAGDILLDSIAARLQAIGENIKNISKNNPQILLQNPSIEWNNIVRFRDYISHHYELLDYEVVYQIGKTYLPPLKEVIEIELKKI